MPFDRVRETTTTTGTGPLTLAGAPTGFRAFASVYTPGAGDVINYVIEGVTEAGVQTGEWEIGTGKIALDGTLVRNVVTQSSNAGNLVNFSAGTKRVYDGVVVGAVQTIATGAGVAAANDAIYYHVQEADPHGDRAYVDGYARPGVTALGSDTVVASFAGTRLQTRAAAGAVTINGTDYAATRDIVLRITNGTTAAIAITVVAAWRWLTPAPTTLGAGQTMTIEAQAGGATEDTVLARMHTEDTAIDLAPVATLMALVDANVVKGLNGTLVANVENLGGVTCSFSALRPAAQPTLTSGVNSEIVFDGSNDHLQAGAASSALDVYGGAATVYMVARFLTSHVRAICGTQSSGVSGWVLLRAAGDAIRFAISSGGSFLTDVTSAAGVLTINNTHLITVVLTTTTIVVRVNGVVVISAAATMTVVPSQNRLGLGGDGRIDSGSNCHMALRVFALFAGAHSAGEIAANEATLAARYGTFPVAP